MPLLKKELRSLLAENTFDYLFVNLSTLAGALPWEALKDTRVLLDHPECEELVYEDYIKKGSFLVKIFSWINLVKFQRFHKKVFANMAAIFCVSDAETDFTKKQVKDGLKVHTVPNGVDTEFFQPKTSFEPKKNTIVLCSGMNIKRNIDAAVWFAHSIFPQVKQKIKDAEFLIAGANPTQEVLDLANIPGIKVTGTVTDIREYYLQGKVFVSPYRFGAGTKLKVLEAMASGIPLVCTSVGCRGIDVKAGVHVLIADDQEHFAKHVIDLLENAPLAQRLSENSLQLIYQQYTWKSIGKTLHELLQSTPLPSPQTIVASGNFLRRLSYNEFFIKTLRFLRVRALARKCYYWWARPKNGILEISIHNIQGAFLVRSADELRLAEAVSGDWGEREVIEALLSEVKQGDVVFDVGANIGIYTILLAKAAGVLGKVIAFEPEPKSYSRLKDNIALNSLATIQVVGKALGNEHKQTTLYVGSIIGNFSMLPLAEKVVSTETVEVVRGDDLIAEGNVPIPNVIKIDVEGYEYAVFEGLRNTLSRPECRILCCEIHPGFFPEGVNEEIIFQYLKSFGFYQAYCYKKLGGPYHVIMKKQP